MFVAVEVVAAVVVAPQLLQEPVSWVGMCAGGRLDGHHCPSVP